MTCNSCYRVNPSGAIYCYNCGARLAPKPERDPWGTSQPDPWTGPGAGSTAPSTRVEHGDGTGYGPARTPDMIYHPDGSMAVGTPPRGWRRGFGRLLAPLALIAYVLSKLKFLLVFAKFGKLGVTAVTMLVSVVVYASVWRIGWAAAVGFVILLFIHEMGHWVVMRFRGRYAPTSRPGYYDISPLQRLSMGALYFGLIAVIAVTLIDNPVFSNIA